MLATILKKEIITNRTASRMIGVTVFVISTSLGAFVRIPLPFTPVPLTLQTFFVLLSGAFLGSGLGFLAQFSYLLIGIAGVPIFSGTGSGLLYLCGPTAGYIVGFALASLFIGRFISYAKNNFLLIFGLLMLGDLILLSCGTIWLRFLLGYKFSTAFLLGFLPFLPGDIIKVSAAGVLYLRLKPRLEQIF